MVDKTEVPQGLELDLDKLTGNVEVQLDDDPDGRDLERIDREGGIEPQYHFENLVEYLTPQSLNELAQDVIEGVDSDKESRQDYIMNLRRSWDNLGLQLEELSEPFEGACSAHHPIIIESAVKFQSKASNELYPAAGPVKTDILGTPTPQKEKKAKRIKDFLNWQITQRIPEYVPDGEKMLLYLCLAGTAIRKVEYLVEEDRPTVTYIPIENFIISDFCSRIEDAYRYTEVIQLNDYQVWQKSSTGE